MKSKNAYQPAIIGPEINGKNQIKKIPPCGGMH
jgi:hypothetical protein